LSLELDAELELRLDPDRPTEDPTLTELWVEPWPLAELDAVPAEWSAGAGTHRSVTRPSAW